MLIYANKATGKRHGARRARRSAKVVQGQTAPHRSDQRGSPTDVQANRLFLHSSSRQSTRTGQRAPLSQSVAKRSAVGTSFTILEREGHSGGRSGNPPIPGADVSTPDRT